MANKRSFRENEALRIAREMLEKNKNNPAPVAPGMPAQTAKNNAYMRALQAFVTQSDFIGSDSAKRGAGDVLAYAMQGDAQANNVVNTLTSNANAKPVQRGDVASWDWETGRQTVIDNAAYMKMLRDAGVFDQEKYATPEYAPFLSTGYLNKMLADTQARWDEDNAYNAQAAAWADKLANDPQFRSTWQHWNDMYNRTGEMTEDNAPYFWAYADYLMGDRAQPFDVNALDEQWGNLSDEDYYAEMARLQTQYEGLDLTGMATANAPQYRDVTGYFDEMDVWQKEINRRQRREELEAFAKGNPVFKDVSVYTPEYNHEDNPGKWVQSMKDPYNFINYGMGYDVETDLVKINPEFSRMQARGYRFLTVDEIAVYNTLYHTDPEKAKEYLDILLPELYQRIADTERMEQTVYAQNGGWAVPMWLGSVGAGLMNMFLLPEQMYAASTGNDDPNAPEFYFHRAQQNIRGAQDEVLGEIEALNGVKIFGKNPAQLLYGGVSMTADNVARLMFGKQGALVTAGLQGASASLYENADRDDMIGAAKIIQALATGALEIGTEKIGLDNLLNMGQDNALKYLLKAIGSEFGEESMNYFGEYGVELAVSWLFGHEGEIRSGEELLYGWGETAVQTLISSGLMSTPGAIKTSSRVRGAGKTAQQQGDIDTLIGISAGMGENSEAGKWAARIKGKREKGARISNYEVGRMTMALEREVGAEMAEAPNKVMDEAIENRLLELGEDADNAKRLAPVLRKTYREQKVTRQDKKDMRWTANAEKVIKELTTDLEASAEEAGSQWKQIAEKSVETAMANAAEKASTFGKAAGLKGKGKAATPVQPVARTEQAADAAAKQGEDLAKNAPKIKMTKGQKVPPKAVAYTDDSGSGSGEVVKFVNQQGKLQVEVETNDGDKTATKIIDPASIDAAGDAGIGAIVSYVQDAEGQTHAMSAEEANAMLQVYQVEGGEANAFIRAFEDAYLAGYANIEMNASTLSEQAAHIAYEQGRAEATKDEKNRVRNASKIREASRGDVSWLGTVTDNADVRGGGSVENLQSAMENMTESQRSTVEVVQAFAKTFKTNVVLFESSEANVEGLQNGSFHEDTNTIYIDINAGANNAQDIRDQKAHGTLGYAIMRTMGHELTHYLEANSTEGYAAYKQAVKNQLKASGQDWATLVREKLDQAFMDGRKLSLSGAEAEVVADASEYMLQDTKFADQIDTSLRGKVQRFVQNFMEKLQNAFRMLTGGHREARAIREAINGVYHYTENLQQLWDAAMEETLGAPVEDTVVDEIREEDWSPAYDDDEGFTPAYDDEEFTPAYDDDEGFTPAYDDEGFTPADTSAADVYEESAADADRTLQDVIEQPTAEETRQEEAATQQRAPEQLIRDISNRFGIEIEVTDSTRRDSTYDAKSGKILIGKNASTGDVLYKALGRELMNRTRGNQSKDLQNALYEVAYAGNYDSYVADMHKVADEINEMMGNFGKRKLGIMSQQVQEEMMARMASQVFGNEQSLINMIETNLTKPTILQRIHTALKNFINKLRGISTPALTPLQRAEQLMAKTLKQAQQTKSDTRNAKGAEGKTGGRYGVNNVQYSTRDAAPETTVREYLADADDSMAVTVEERNALKIYQDRLQAHAEATQAVLDAENAMKGKDGEELKDARAALARARATQKEQYNLLLKLEGTEHLRNVMERTQQFIQEEISGKTSEDIAAMIAEREQTIVQLEKDMKDLKGAARAQMEADIRDHKRVVRALKNKATYRLEKRTAEFRAREQKAREYRRTRDDVNKLRRKIGRDIKRLNNLTVRATDKKHVPDELQHVANVVMQIFTEGELSRLAFSAEHALELQRTYRILGESDSDVSHFYDEELDKDIESLMVLQDQYTRMRKKDEQKGNIPSFFTKEGVMLQREILESVDRIISNVMHMITTENDAFIEGREETFREYATKTVEALEKKKDHKRIAFGVGKKLETLSGAVNYGNKTPIYFFQELGIPQLEELGQKLFDAEDKYGIRYAEADTRLRGILEKYNYWAWDRNKTVTFKTEQAITQEMLENGKTANKTKHVVTLNLGEAMALYATWKREHQPDSLIQTKHLENGGFVRKKPIREGVFEKKDETPHLLKDADFRYIDDVLTKEQKTFVDEMVQFMTEYGDIYGNETSMKLFGYKKFNDKYYYPITVQRNQLKKNSDAATRATEDGRIKNMKSSKRRINQAATPVEIGDFLETVQDHIQQMILYNTFAEPIEDLNRVLNYAYEDASGSRKTVRGLIEQKYGKNATDYIDKLTADLNGGLKTDKAETVFMRMFSMFKKSRVVASLSVALQQPTSIIRAMVEVNPKYFVPLTGKANINLSQEYDQLKKHSGVAVLKELGGFDMTNTYSMARNLGGTETDGYSIFKKMRTAFLAGGPKNIQDRARAASKQWNTAFGWLASKADKIAWISMWIATKNETHAKYPNMDVNSDEFLDLAGQRFNEVMRLTQVYDSTMARSQNMRSNTMGMKMITSFAAEPTLTANMLQGAFKSKNGKKIARAIAVYYASQIITAAAAAIIKAGRDDDESKTYEEKFLSSMGNALGGYSGGLNPLSQIPGVRDLLSLLDGYDLERGDMSIFADLFDEFEKLIDGKYEDNPKAGIEKAGGAIANLFGIPLENIMRDVRSIWNSVNSLANPPRETNLRVLMNDAMKNYSLRFIFEPDTSVNAYYARLCDALIKDDMDEVDDLTAYLGVIGKDENAIISGVRTAYKDRYLAGGITKEDAVQFLLDNDLAADRKAAFTYVDKWEEGGENPSVYKSIRKSIQRNDMDAVDEGIAELIDNGWTAAQVYKELKNDVDTHYMVGNMSQADYKRWYNTHAIAAGNAPRDDNDWYWVFKELDWGKAHGGSTEGYDMHAELWQAVDTGTNLRATINEYQSHGRTREDLNRAMNNHYEPILIDLYQNNRAEFTRVQARVLTAYAQLGYDREDKRKLIESWVK